MVWLSWHVGRRVNLFELANERVDGIIHSTNKKKKTVGKLIWAFEFIFRWWNSQYIIWFWFFFTIRIVHHEGSTPSIFQGCDDDGETHAGSRMLHLLQVGMLSHSFIFSSALVRRNKSLADGIIVVIKVNKNLIILLNAHVWTFCSVLQKLHPVCGPTLRLE